MMRSLDRAHLLRLGSPRLCSGPRGQVQVRSYRKANSILAFLLLCLPIMVVPGHAEKAVRFSSQLVENYRGNPPQAGVIDRREFVCPYNVRVNGLAGNFIFDLTVTPISKKMIGLELELFTFGGQPEHFLRIDTLNWGETLTLASLPLKGRSTLQWTLVPSPAETTFECDTSPLDSTFWNYEGSPRFIFYYRLWSLGDFQWNRWRDNLEDELDALQRTFDLTTPERVRFYYFPCQTKALVWDRRFPFAVDPLRYRVCAVHQPGKSGVDPFPVILEKICHLWGYAPALLAEGLAGYLDYSHYYAQQDLRAGRLLKLATLSKSQDYYAQPAKEATIQAASFVRYLATTYGGARLEQLYRQATDLSLDSTCTAVYGKPLEGLEAEWRAYLDTFPALKPDLNHFAERALRFGHYRDALELFQKLVALDSTDEYEVGQLVLTHYLLGQYPQGLKLALTNLHFHPTAENQVVAANFFLLADQLDSAVVHYRAAMQGDSLLADPYVRLGSFYVERGDESLGVPLLEEALRKRIADPDRAELSIALGQVAKRRGDLNEMAVALNNSWALLRNMRTEDPSNSFPYYLLGEMFLVKGFLDSAIANLQTAQFVEERPYYLGKIALALGKAYDLKKQRKEAVAAYQFGLNVPSIPFDRRRLERYLKKPFRE